jgi:hypothetical protein
MLGAMISLVNPPAAKTRSACVVVGVSPAQVNALGESDRVAVRANRLGTLLTGDVGDRPIDFADIFPGPIYDVMYNPGTGWFSVTIFHGNAVPVRWDNRTGDAGYPRVPDIRGATTPEAILMALDISVELLRPE